MRRWTSTKSWILIPRIATLKTFASKSKDEDGQRGHEAVVKMLLENGTQLESKDKKYGQTLLLWAAENGHEAVVKLLLEKGAELECKDNCGRTSLWLHSSSAPFSS